MLPDDDLISLDEAVACAGKLAAPGNLISDGFAANLFLFRATHRYRFVDGLYPRVEGVTYDGASIVMPLFDPGTLNDGETAALLGEDRCFFPLDRDAADRLGARFDISCNTDDSDYVFAANRLATLVDSKDRRRQARRLLDQGTVALISREDGRFPAAADTVLRAWAAEPQRSGKTTDEAQCLAALDHAHALGLEGLAAFVDGMPAGFLLASRRADIAVVHFAKGLSRFDGVYPLLFSEFAGRNPGLSWINFEQDLGNPRFRQAKRAYGPAMLVHKYRARPKVP